MSNQPEHQEWGNVAAPDGQPSFDFLGMLQRRFWVIILCLLFASGGGFFWFWKSDVKFTSYSRANIFQKNNNVSIIGNNRFSATAQINSHDQIIKSESVLYNAADEILRIIQEGEKVDEGLGIEPPEKADDEKNQVANGEPADNVNDGQILQSLQGKSRAQIMAHLSGAIDVKQDRDDKNIYQISYSGSAKNDCPIILGIVLKSYENHLLKIYENENQEILKNIHTAQENIEMKIQTKMDDLDRWRNIDKADEFAELQNGIFVTAEGKVNHYRVEAQNRYTELEALKKKESDLLQDRDWIKSAIEAKMSKQEILTHINKFNEWLNLERGRIKANSNATATPPDLPLQFEEPEPPLNLIQARLQVSNIQLELDDFADRGFGANHPEVKARNRTLTTAKLQLDTLETLHKERVSRAKQKFEELQKHRKEMLANNKTEPVVPSVIEDIDLIGLHESFIAGELARVKADISNVSTEFESKRLLANRVDSLLKEEGKRQSEIDEQKALNDVVLAKISEFNIDKENGGYRVDILNSPSLAKQTEPSALKIFAITSFIGMLVGVGLSYLIEIADKTFRTPEEIAKQLGLQVIGHVPVLSTKKVNARGSALDESLVAYHLPKSQQAEAFRAIRTSIFFNSQGKNNQIIQVTSPTPEDGKSTMAANLAISLAQSGKRVLIVDSDLRRPTVNYLFGVDSETGFAAVLNGDSEIDDAILESEVEGLSVMPAGNRPSNPAELLTSSHLSDLFEVLREKFDFVIMDSPPLLAVTDPSAVAARCDGVILALRIKKNIKLAASRAKEILNSVNAKVIGTVVNGAGMIQGSYTYGGYGHDYTNSYYSYGYDYGESSYYYDEDHRPTPTRQP